MDDEQRYQAAASKDARFDGVFFTAVTSTGIYCRPSCPAMTPKRENVRFYSTAAAAQQAGFRACKRCRPDASPGSPEWNVRADVTARAMRLIADGIVDREGVAGLADRLGYEQRQVRRVLTAELGASPLALARAQRAQTARVLVETTKLPMGDIAFAAGFASIRQFNATMLEVFDTPPTRLRERAAKTAAPAPPGVLRVRLPYRPPIDLTRLLSFLAARAVPGVEEVTGRTYSRTISLPNGGGILSLRAVPSVSIGWSASWCLTTCGTSPPRCSGAGACSTWTRTRSRSPGSWRATRLSARWRGPARGGGPPATSTATSSPCGRCSASRCPSPPPAALAPGSSPNTASRSSSRTAR